MTYTRQTTRYTDIMISLARSPKTTREIAKDLGLTWYQSVSDVLAQMRKLGIVRVEKWKATENACGMKAAVWTTTPGIDAPAPVTKAGKVASNLDRRQVMASANLIAFAHVWDGLDVGRKTTYDLAEMSGFTVATVQEIVKRLHDAQLIYVSRYDRKSTGGDPIKRYSLGYRMPDVEKPQPENVAIYNEKRRIRNRLNAFERQRKAA